MDDANTGVIYFNFGTILNVAGLPKPTVRILIKVLERLEQKVIFKWDKNDTQGFPDNFYVDSWFPQQEILSNYKHKTKYIQLYKILKIIFNFYKCIL